MVVSKAEEHEEFQIMTYYNFKNVMDRTGNLNVLKKLEQNVICHRTGANVKHRAAGIKLG